MQNGAAGGSPRPRTFRERLVFSNLVLCRCRLRQGSQRWVPAPLRRRRQRQQTSGGRAPGERGGGGTYGPRELSCNWGVATVTQGTVARPRVNAHLQTSMCTFRTRDPVA